jgi:hypothetical protein
MHIRSALAATILFLTAHAAQALEPQYYTVYCADGRIEVSMWDLEQMQVRRGSDVCQFTRYTSYSSALTFADKNFGGEDEPCVC